MDGKRMRLLPIVTLAMFLLASSAPAIAQGVGLPNISIHVDWIDHDGDEEAEHAYVIEFSEAPTPSDWRVEIAHSDSSGALIGNWTYRWGDANHSLDPVNATHYRVEAPTNLSFGDSVDIEVWMEDGTFASAARTVEATLWNQPLADHEITITTDWTLRHQIENETTEEYVLDFSGQGWQRRADGILQHDELGSGTLIVDESTEDGNVYMEIDLSLIWLNETIQGDELISQIFEMAGTGNLTITGEEDGALTTITANVVDAYIRRAVDLGVVDEEFRLEANGNLNVSSQSNDSDMWIDGDLSLLLIEMHDIGGERVLGHTEFQATAEMELQEDGAYTFIDVSEIYSLSREENGSQVAQHDKIIGDGTFYFSDTNDDNGSIVVNGDVLIFHIETQDNAKIADAIHVDGDISGATTGTFGLLRGIDSTGTTANSTGQLWPVNVIHSENWFNLSGGGIMGGFGASQYYNETFDHEVVFENCTNRTVYYRWYEQSDEPSQGEEWPEDSPLNWNIETTTPDTECAIEEEDEEDEDSDLGDINVSRELGIAPSVLLAGDNVGLYASEFMHLELNADSYETYTRDGHVMNVTRWSGTYGEEGGTATGLVVNDGILAGLLAEVSRSVFIDIDDEQDAQFWENQSLERVLSPSIISASENTAPVIVAVTLHEGMVVNEGGNLVHIQVQVDDPDWNIREVTVDLSNLGLGELALNDIGLDGDIIVHDDNFTGSFVYYGTDAGNISIDITVSDDWTDTTASNLLPVNHRAPRLIDFTLTPDTIFRGEELAISARGFDSIGVTSIAIDLRGEGGDLFELTDDGAGLWSGNVSIPSAVTPGDLLLPVRLEDSAGGYATVTRLHTTSSQAGTGGDAWNAPTISIPAVTVVNEGPSITEFTILLNDEAVESIQVPGVGDGPSTYVLTVQASDPDSITVVQGRLGMLAPIGQDTTWQSMLDDGQGADATAGDGIYSIEVIVREGLPANTIEIQFRGIDVFLATTSPLHTESIQMSDEDLNPQNNPGEVLFDLASATAVILILLGILLLGGGIAVVVILRRGGDMDEQLGIITDFNELQ